MAGFLEVLVKDEELHQLPRRADLLERRRLVDHPGPLARRLAIEGMRSPFCHCPTVPLSSYVGGYVGIAAARDFGEGLRKSTGRKNLAELLLNHSWGL